MIERKIYTSFRPRTVGGTLNDEPSLTEQSHAASCDINVIIRRATSNGDISGLMPSRPLVYGDAPDFDSYHESLNVITRAQQSFETLPASLREKFGNSIGEFLKALDDPANRPELVKLGILSEVPEKVVPDETLVIKGTTDTAVGGSTNNGDKKDV